MPTAPPTADAPHHTVAEIDLGRLRHNVRTLQARAGEADLMGVVKADAYGHGARRVAAVLQEEGVRHFAVATVPEAADLRAAGLETPLLVFGAPLPQVLPAYVRHRLDVTVNSAATAEAVIATARAVGPLRVHVKVDTGMGRIGLTPEEAPAVIRRLDRAPGVTLAGLWTHFATADELGDTYAAEQLRTFRTLTADLDAAPEHLHTANSGALLQLAESFEHVARPLVRTGIALYGLMSEPELADEAGLQPVMRLVTRVTHLKTVAPGTTVSYGRRWTAERPTRIATLGAGYADGYPRLLTNRATVGLGGRTYPVAGTVCMDMTMADLGDPDGPGRHVQVGDEAVLFGPGGPSTNDVARWAETIPYEICCGVSPRVVRRYVDAG